MLGGLPGNESGGKHHILSIGTEYLVNLAIVKGFIPQMIVLVKLIGKSNGNENRLGESFSQKLAAIGEGWLNDNHHLWIVVKFNAINKPLRLLDWVIGRMESRSIGNGSFFFRFCLSKLNVHHPYAPDGL